MKIKAIRKVTKVDKRTTSDVCGETSGNGLEKPPC
jgi:hypothetical protein